MSAIQIFNRWNLLSMERINLNILKNKAAGAEQTLYRTLFQDVSAEMEALTPQIQNIFKRIRSRRIVKDIMAIYFENISYPDWAETCGIPVEDLCREVRDALEAIDCEIEVESA